MTSDVQDRLLRIRTVLDRTGLSRSTLYRMIDDGEFPQQILISARCVAWRESAVTAWMKAAMSQSSEEPSKG